ncbi:ABC transporter ATP-binding protein [Nisaea acidiphila]|uniref:ABC transporter ATP-binding protein n=1 Tax=Nisaea acidiphila TaxID=1862145 RepID=A0A9J7AQG7_9PROT|nr:ABC transporter ATP-binding protein [Nisaea acidiphila]UUX48841.1 ABC transporter ATP-binding protein [Nisaea acidiphila]
MSGIRYQNISKSFGEVEVIRSLDLEIAEGEFVVYVGPSGCGKTTLLRMLAGLEPVSDGRIFIGDRDVTDVSPKERNISMVFQNYALYPHMTVAENIGFGLRLQGVARAERDAAVRETAEMLGLGGLLERKPRALSGGQRQRVAMGRAIIRQPDAFLMDEPLSNLDAQLRNHMRTEIKALQSRLGTTTIYVTHDQVEAMTMADRIVVLNGGVIQQIGTPDELYSRPANRFVAGFIGAPVMNFLPAKKFNTALPAEGAAEIGIRPDDLKLCQKEGPMPVQWPARVELVEPLGGEALVHVAFGDQRACLKHRDGVRPASGEEIEIGFEPGDAHFFAADGTAHAIRDVTPVAAS